MTNYDMANRTYRYLPDSRPPLFPFGYGLSYSDFWYLSVSHNSTRGLVKKDDIIEVVVIVANVGQRKVLAEEQDEEVKVCRMYMYGVCVCG